MADLGVVQAERLLHLAHFRLYALQPLSGAQSLPRIRAAQGPRSMTSVHPECPMISPERLGPAGVSDRHIMVHHFGRSTRASLVLAGVNGVALP